MSNITYKLPVDSGKYTFIMYEGDWRIHVLRYNAPWLIIEKGHNAIFSLLCEAIDTKEELEKLKKEFKIESLTDDKAVSFVDQETL